MVEDGGGLGYKFQSAGRRTSRDGSNRTIRVKLDKIVQLSKEAWNFIFEKRWWIILTTGISLIIVSVRVKYELVLPLFFRDPC